MIIQLAYVTHDNENVEDVLSAPTHINSLGYFGHLNAYPLRNRGQFGTQPRTEKYLKNTL